MNINERITPHSPEGATWGIQLYLPTVPPLPAVARLWPAQRLAMRGAVRIRTTPGEYRWPPNIYVDRI